MSNYRRGDENKKLRKQAGQWLKELRTGSELTQVEAAQRLGYGYYTFIGQIEMGRSRVPPEDWRKWANLYGVPDRRFAMKLLQHYDPHVYEMLREEGGSAPR